MTEIERLQDELTAASNALTKKFAESRRLLSEIPVDSAKVQLLMQQLAALRQSMPDARPAMSQPRWYDNAPQEGQMGDRSLN